MPPDGNRPMKEKSPAFQFYPADWLSSSDVLLMSPAEEGAYIHLLALAWLEDDCGLPDDDVQLAALSRLGRAWAKSGPRLRSRFRSEGGRIYNDRLLRERQKQDNYRHTQKESGRVGAKKRWGSHSDPIGDPIRVPNGVAINSPMAKNSSSFSSSFSSSENTPLPPTIPFFEQFRQAYEYTGKPLNERDWDLACREWVSQELDGQGAEVLAQLIADAKFKWEDLRRNHEYDMIPFPANWLKKQPWTREQVRTA